MSVKMDKLEKLAALIASKEYLKPYEVGALWAFEASKTCSYIDSFREEISRADSKIPDEGYIYHSRKSQWIHRDMFKYYMVNHISLTDEVERKNVLPYKKEGLG